MKLTFAEWKSRIDKAVWALVGLSSDDLDDVPLADWYEDGVGPKTAAARAIRWAS